MVMKNVVFTNKLCILVVKDIMRRNFKISYVYIN
jgi:hypothetical protein